jgi:hypothetical protein
VESGDQYGIAAPKRAKCCTEEGKTGINRTGQHDNVMAIYDEEGAKQ